MASINLAVRPFVRTIKSKFISYSTLLAGLGVGFLIGFLVVTGNWIFAVGFVFALPVFILLHRYPWLAVLIWMFLAPIFTVTDNSGGRQFYWVIHRALPPATIAIMLIAFSLGINRRRFPKLGFPEVMMAGYVVVSLLSILTLNDKPQATFYEFYDRVMSPMCLYLVIRLWAPSADDLKRLAPVVLFLLISQSLIGLIAWYQPSLLPSAWIDEELRTTGSLGSYGAYAATMMFCGLFLLQAALNRQAGWVRFLYLLSFALAGFGVFMSFSRGAWAAGALVLLGLLLIDQKRMFQVGLVVVPLVFYLAQGPLSTQVAWASERLYSERSEQSALVRLPVIQASLQMLLEKPLFGWGYENFNRYDWQFYQPVQGVAAPVKDISSHNFYLTLLAEQGVIGTLLFLFPMFWWLARSLKELRTLPGSGFWSKRSLILSWLFIFAYMTINMFHNMRTVFGLALWWVGLALIANAVEGDHEDEIPAVSSQRSTLEKLQVRSFR